MRVRVEGFARWAGHHPWLAALPFSILAGIVCVIVALVTGGPSTGTGLGIPIFLASWAILGSRLRLAHAAARIEHDQRDQLGR